MPTNLNLKGGGVTRRPGVYGSVDASALDQVALETNVVALVGDWPFLAKATAISISSPRSMIELQPLYEDLALAAKVLYNSALDDRVLGGPSRVILMNVQPTTQAAFVLDDSAGANSIKITSKKYGFTGNQVSTSLAVAGATFTFTFAWNGISEEFQFDGETGMSLSYTGSDAATMTVDYDNTAGLIIAFTSAPKGEGVYTFGTGYDYPFDGQITIDPDTTPTGSQTFTAIIEGTTAAGGTNQSETLTFANSGGGAAQTTVNHFTNVTKITFAETGTQNPAFVISGNSFNLSPSNFANVGAFVDRINDTANFTAVAGSPKTSKIPAGELDDQSAVTIKGATVELKAHQYTIMQKLASSALITPQRVGNLPPVAQATAFLGGGNETTASGTDWDDAFNALRSETPQIVWIDSNDIAIGQKLAAHCKYMAGQGGSECQGWYGQAANQDLATTKSNSAKLNSRFLWGLCYQEVDIIDPAGVVQRKGPEWQALTLAGIQAGTDVGTPLTFKRPNVLEVHENPSMKSDLEANRNLDFGLLFFTKDRLGLRVERSITTYQEDDNPIFSEGSAVESINTSIRDLRNNLQKLVGNPTSTATRGRIRSITINRLRIQVVEEIIKDFILDSVKVDDLGDTFRVSYTVAPVEPLNFIQIEAQVARIPSAG